MKIKSFLHALLCSALLPCLLLCGCRQSPISYVCITAQQAKELMDSQPDCIILDVRTQQEYDLGHIPGALLIPNEVISEEAEKILKEKDQLILVYCRSGRRSKEAAQKLCDLGYTNVKEFGGIIDWPYQMTR